MPAIPMPQQQDFAAAAQRLRGRLPVTPLLGSPDLDGYLGMPLWLKAENLQPTGSFKVRGALNWLATASPTELGHGLVTVSAGNHALALAWAAARKQVPVTVVMPEGSSALKIRGTRELGARVLVQGTIQQAVERCWQFVREDGMTLVHPYNDARVMAGQGTVGLELLHQLPDVERILCPVGGGGLISGVGLAIRACRPEVELIGIEPEGAATMNEAWRHLDPAHCLASVSTWAGSLAPAVVGDITYAASRQVVDRMITVSEENIREATRLLLTRGRLWVEPGASVGLAALISGTVEHRPEKTTALIITGGNLDPEEVSQLFAP